MKRVPFHCVDRGILWLTLMCFVVILLGADRGSAGEREVRTGPQMHVVHATRVGVSPPLRSFVGEDFKAVGSKTAAPRSSEGPWHQAWGDQVEERLKLILPNTEDRALQRGLPASRSPGDLGNPLINIAGNSVGELGVPVAPADSNGDVGRDYYVQWVNLHWSIYDKRTGIREFGPYPGNAFWSGFGGLCETHNDGNPIVIFDHLADRWLMSQFAVSPTGGGHQCIAVSQSSDPSGTYYLYDYTWPEGLFNDYPKLGLWPNAYLVTANEFDSGNFASVGLGAFDRQAMIAGDPSAQLIVFHQSMNADWQYFSAQPVHLEGPAPSNPDLPGLFINAQDSVAWGIGAVADAVHMWSLNLDWDFWYYSTLDGPVDITSITNFDQVMCNFSRSCIPQPDTGNALDPLAIMNMYRAQYRDMGTHESLVLNLTVDVGTNQAGVRWFEFRRSGSTSNPWALYQEGTYAPDTEHRWMGSIAMDISGNIAIAYSVSSSSIYPSIRYTGRVAGDPLGVMTQGEKVLIDGTGSELATNRWGDYSSLSVDPDDNCTFWYTQEYLETSGSFEWTTRIGSFKFDSCQGPLFYDGFESGDTTQWSSSVP